MGEGTPRAIVLGMLRLERKLDLRPRSRRLADGARFAPPPLSAGRARKARGRRPHGAPPWVAGDYPEWLDPHFARVFAEERAAEGARAGEPRPA